MTQYSINYIPGEIVQKQKELKLDYICHQVNCQGKMNSGVAKAIREAYPEVYVNYKFKCDQAAVSGEKRFLLGTIQMVPLYDDYYVTDYHPQVCNFFSQFDYGYDGKRYTSYDAFWNCLHLFKQIVPAGASVGFPARIGCDRGGANWAVILQMISEVLGKDYNIYIIDYDGGNENENSNV